MTVFSRFFFFLIAIRKLWKLGQICSILYTLFKCVHLHEQKRKDTWQSKFRILISFIAGEETSLKRFVSLNLALFSANTFLPTDLFCCMSQSRLAGRKEPVYVNPKESSDNSNTLKFCPALVTKKIAKIALFAHLI